MSTVVPTLSEAQERLDLWVLHLYSLEDELKNEGLDLLANTSSNEYVRKRLNLINMINQGKHIDATDMVIAEKNKGLLLNAQRMGRHTGYRNPLHVAAISGYDEMVRFLLNNGAKVDSTDYMNVTPLTFAVLKAVAASKLSNSLRRELALNKYLKIIKLLTEKGASHENMYLPHNKDDEAHRVRFINIIESELRENPELLVLYNLLVPKTVPADNFMGSDSETSRHHSVGLPDHVKVQKPNDPWWEKVKEEQGWEDTSSDDDEEELDDGGKKKSKRKKRTSKRKTSKRKIRKKSKQHKKSKKSKKHKKSNKGKKTRKTKKK